MKLSKRAGALLLAVGAGVVTAQGAAAAAPMTPGQVAAIEDELATKEVPFTIPLGAATDPLPLLPAGGKISGGVPTSLLMPPVPEGKADHQLIPDRIVPSIPTGKVGPALQASVPLPTADRSTELGDLLVDAPAAPLNAGGPGLTLGQPVTWVEGSSGQLADGALGFGEIDPQLITAPVQAIPGAKASLGGDDKRISVTDSLKSLTATTTGTVTGVLDQTQA
ncbi:hypothetical protein GCM10010193_29950 [Kitasatospora atroaurantiaca]|uniref:GLTT repeat-containing protein n=1 Tax=Kitasatospora atroaurantiaca TaxID=285545 RepID=A0A561EQU1_9ACTN|nr:hypothetical protein [Kitasatospora atroaurantiaca]TWE17983.1 hypothetical protein FB465_3030 [Kitasatospora atroaurantiaca]